jgi:class 3 adenylate cyclase
LEWGHPIFGRIYERLAERNTLIRFDRRGTGLSERVYAGLTSSLLDVEAVVERLNLAPFDLIGVQTGGFTVMRYALTHPDRVRRMVLIDGFARSADIAATAQIRALLAAGQADFMMMTEMIAAGAIGPGREESKDYGAYVRACINEDYFPSLGDPTDPEVQAEGDFTAELASIKTPALVIRHAGLQFITPEMSRDLAARLPNAQYAEVDGLWADEPKALSDRVHAFLHDAPSSVQSTRTDESGVRTILFTDIEGHTQMMQRLGDDAGRALLREHERITREVIARHGGAEIKTIGDAFMVSFGSVASAAQCAVDLQQAIATGRMTEPLKIRIGLNAGEPIAEDGDLFGSSVILASRIVAQAIGGEILVSDVVRGLLSGKPFLFSDRGEIALRGFEDPVRLYELRWQPA